jgi:hypothetical protein
VVTGVRLSDQRGNALVTTVMLVAMGFLALALLMDFLGIYVAKRPGQTAADAAALGALQAAEQSFNQVLSPALQAKVDTLLRAVAQEVGRRMEEWEDNRRSSLRAGLEGSVPPLTEDEIQRKISETISNERPGVLQSTRHSVIRSMVRDSAVENALIDGQPVPPLPGLGEFFTARERGCLVRSAGEQGANEIRSAANWFAEQNGVRAPVEVMFPYQNQIKVRVVVSAPVPLGLTARFAPTSETLLPVEATSRAADLGIPFDLSGPC